jgi:hypothetical protein
MLACTTAQALHQLLDQRAAALHPADAAAAWHVAAQGRLLTLARSGDAAQGGLLAALLRLTERLAPGMDATALSTTAWALAATSADAGPHLAAVMAAARAALTSFRPQELCVLLWAAATHPGLAPPERLPLFEALGGALQEGMTLSTFSAHDLSVLVWALGRVGCRHAPLLAAAQAECGAKVAGLAPPDAARLMHGFAMLRHRPPTLLPPLAAHCHALLPEFAPEDVALLLVSLGKLDMDPGHAFLAAAAARAAALVPTVSRRRGAPPPALGEGLHPRHLAHLLWAYARMDSRSAERALFPRALRHLAAAPGLYSGEDVSAMLWACARTGFDPPGERDAWCIFFYFFLNNLPHSLNATLAAVHCAAVVVQTAAERMLALAGQESPQTLAYALSSLGTLASRQQGLAGGGGGGGGTAVDAFAAAAAACLAPHAAKLEPGDLAAVVVALGTLEARGVPGRAAGALQAACAAAAGELPAAALPRVAWAAVRLQWRGAQPMDAVAAAGLANLALLPPEGLAQMAWAFAAAERHYPELAAGLASACGRQLPAFRAGDKARLAWAFTQLSRRGEPGAGVLLRLVQAVTAADLRAMSPEDVAAVVFACARLEQHPG